MVERLSTLLREEVAGIDVPPAPAAAILRGGQGRRRRRRVAEGVAGLAAIGLVVAGVGTLVTRANQGPDGNSAQLRFATASAVTAYEDYGAFAAGSTVYIGNHRVTFPEKIKALYYTSVGVLVRMGQVAHTDASGPSHYTLVHPDGSTKQIDLRMGDRIAGTDPDSPNVAYAEPTGATGELSATETRRTTRWSLVVVSLETGAEVARTEVTGSFTWGGWEAPPVDLAGDRMWALLDTGWTEYDWKTGTTRVIQGTSGAGILDAAHGRYALHGEETQTDWRVFDFVTGDQVATVPVASGDVGWMSPDGRYLRLDKADAVFDGETGKMISPPSPSRFVSVDTGKVVAIPGQVFWGWTPQGHALSVDAGKDRLTVCDPATGSCDRIDLKIGSGKVKLGGLSYES
jgi:hypothetical protein